jgi:hypothetical protein
MAKAKAPTGIAQTTSFSAALDALGMSTVEASRLIEQGFRLGGALEGMSDEAKEVFNLFLRALPRSDRVILQKLAQEGKLNELQARLDNKVSELKVKGVQQLEQLTFKRETGERLASVRSLEKQTQTEQVEGFRTAREAARPGLKEATIVATTRGEIESERLKAAAAEARLEPLAASARVQLADINTELSKAAPIDADRVQERLTKLKEATAQLPEVEAERALAETRLLSRQDRAVTETASRLKRLGIESADALTLAEEQVRARAHPLDTRPNAVRDSRIVRQIRAVQDTERLILQEAPASGFRVRGGRVPTTGAADFLVREKPSMFGGKAAAGAASGLQELMLTAREKGATAEPGMIRNILQKAAKAPGRTKALGAAVGLPLLLMSLFKGKDTQQMNPMMQIRLLQQMAEQQQAGRLNEAKSMSQEANAQQAMARAALLRAQLMQVMGGGLQPSVF